MIRTFGVRGGYQNSAIGVRVGYQNIADARGADRTGNKNPDSGIGVRGGYQNIAARRVNSNHRAARFAITIASLAILATNTAQSLYAQGAYAGTWHVTAWKPAPWVPAGEQATTKPSKLVIDHNVTFSKARIVGPPVIACAGPKYQIKNVPFDELFEGSLKQPTAEAAALGFKAPVKTLMPGCDMEFHSISADTVMFALNNVLYSMVRTLPKSSTKP